jgi:hypothetical protein
MNRVGGGRKALIGGMDAEREFDAIADLWRVQGIACLGSGSPPTRLVGSKGNLRTIITGKGSVDRVGVIAGVAVAIEIKSSVGKWRPSGKSWDHEIKFLHDFYRCGGCSMIVIREGELGNRQWYVAHVTSCDLPGRDTWRTIRLEHLPSEIRP